MSKTGFEGRRRWFQGFFFVVVFVFCFVLFVCLFVCFFFFWGGGGGGVDRCFKLGIVYIQPR